MKEMKERRMKELQWKFISYLVNSDVFVETEISFDEERLEEAAPIEPLAPPAANGASLSRSFFIRLGSVLDILRLNKSLVCAPRLLSSSGSVSKIFVVLGPVSNKPGR